MKNGLSLISLIITVIVIIILAMIVIFSGLKAPDMANLAKYFQDFSEYRTIIMDDFMNKKSKYALDGKTRTNAQIYYIIAVGDENALDVNDLPVATGLVEELNSYLSSELLHGTEYYEIKSDTSIEGIGKQKRFYETSEKHYVTDEGDVFMLPGYLVNEDGINRWYINERTYYESDLGVRVDSLLSYNYKVGDYVDYKPKGNVKYIPLTENAGTTNIELEPDMDTKWRIIYIDNATRELYITPGIVNTIDKFILYGVVGYLNGVEELKTTCEKLYSNEDKGITASSMTIEDLNKICDYKPPVIAGYKYHSDSSEYGTNLTEMRDHILYTNTVPVKKTRRFYNGDGGRTDTKDGISYQTPEEGNPVYVKNTYFAYDYPDNVKEIINYKNAQGWIASSCVKADSSGAEYNIYLAYPNGVDCTFLASSGAWQEEIQAGLLPIVKLNSAMLKDKGSGTYNEPWTLK